MKPHHRIAVRAAALTVVALFFIVGPCRRVHAQVLRIPSMTEFAPLATRERCEVAEDRASCYANDGETARASYGNSFVLVYIGDKLLHDRRVLLLLGSEGSHLHGYGEFQQMFAYRSGGAWVAAPGWVVLPVSTKNAAINGVQWIEIWTQDDRPFDVKPDGHCALPMCGATLILPKTKVSDLPSIPSGNMGNVMASLRRRAVTH